MRWPVHFPYPISWLRAFTALFLTVGFGFSLRLTGFWGLIFTTITGRLLPLIVLMAVGLIIPVFLVAYTHHLLWGRSDYRRFRWLPRAVSWREGLNALIVIVVASLISTIVLMPFIGCYIANDDIDCLPPTEQQLQFALVIWLTTAAYLYQYDYLIRHRRASKLKLKVPQLSKPGSSGKNKPQP